MSNWSKPMVRKSHHYWSPDAKGHLSAASLLSKTAPNLTKSPPLVVRKVASFRAAAKLAHQNPAQKMPALAKTIDSPTPAAKSPTPNASPAVKPSKEAELSKKVPNVPKKP